MNVVSLFSGIGGMDHGLARAGFRHLAFCEGGGDPNGTKAEREQWKTGVYRRSVLAARWPGVPVYEDVAALRVEPAAGDPGDGRVSLSDGAGRVHTIPVPRLVAGGTPCQDLSVAGQRRGLMHEGGRSNLFFEYARVVDSLRPEWILWENVPGAFSSNGGRDFGTVLGTLADVGYGVAWRVLDSRFFGVPQRRRRVFIVGALADGDPRAAAERAGEILAVGTRCAGHPATRGEAREDLADASDVGFALRRDPGGIGQGHNTNYVASTMKSQRGKGGGGIGPEETLIAGPLGGGNDGVGGGKPGEGYAVRRLMPVECERLQALPDGHTDLGGTADSKRYAALGDAVTASVSEWIGRRLVAA